MDGYWITRTFKAGKVGEKVKFFVSGNCRQRNKRKEKQAAKKVMQNEASAIKRMARLLNANFSAGDCLLTLSYSEQGMERVIRRAACQSTDPEEYKDAINAGAAQELTNCLRRVKYALDKQGIENMYLGITADIDPETGEEVRVHHHIVVKAGTEEAFIKAWQKYGHVNIEHLSKQEDYLPIAVYFCKQVRHQEDAKMYTRSRNMIVPEGKDRVSHSGSEIRLPKHCRMVQRNEWRGQYAPQYIRYILPDELEEEQSA